MRQYDEGLIAEMRARQRVEESFGIPVLLKPVPDAPEHTLDPRLVEVIERKRHMFSSEGGKGFRLSAVRNRPDKVSYEIASESALVDERLIDVDGTHMIDVYVFRALTCEPGCPILVYLHGGGFTAGDVRLFEKQMSLISELAGAVVVFPEYRLAPECPFPGAIDDAWASVRWAADHAHDYGARGDALALAGDSAGGSLACACVQRDIARHGTCEIARRLVLTYAAVDKGDYLKQDAYAWSWDAYDVVEGQRDLVRSRIERIKGGVDRERAGETSLYLQGKTTERDPLVSAVYAPDGVLEHFPRTVVATSEYDYLRLGGEYFASLLASHGVDVTLMRYLGCDHGFFDLLGVLPQAEELCLTIAEELRGLVGEVSCRE